MSKIKTIFIVGPTASGKTALGVALARSMNGEVVSADSMQIYKGIHIASAAPDEAELCGVPHYLLEFLAPDEAFSVADYVELARERIREIADRGKQPFVVGGTGLYISSLADNTAYMKEETDPALRAELERQLDEIGAEQMLLALAQFDPQTAARLHPNNRRRIIRAFEVYKTTGRTMTEQNRLSHSGEGIIDPLMIGITYRNREILYDRIGSRVDKMLENGLLEEARSAYRRKTGGAAAAIGHKELFRFVEGECSLAEAAENLKRQTRRYAKRQLTWFCRDDKIHWIYADETKDTVSAAREIIERKEAK